MTELVHSAKSIVVFLVNIFLILLESSIHFNKVVTMLSAANHKQPSSKYSSMSKKMNPAIVLILAWVTEVIGHLGQSELP